jgi:hypothetical protein
MIKNKFLPQKIIVFVLYAFLIISAMNLQTTVWYSFFGYFPAPCFWAPFFVYLMMNRPFPRNFLWLVFFYLLFLTQTASVPLTLFLSLTALWAVIIFFQKRISTLGLFDFILFSAGSVVLFPVIYFMFSFVGEPVASIDLISILITLFLSIPVIPVALVMCKKIDASFDPMNSNVESLVLDI